MRPSANRLIALWRFGRCEGIPVQAQRLQHRQLGTELCRFDRRCQRITHCLSTSRRYQDQDTEQELRKPRERLPNRFQHDEE